MTRKFLALSAFLGLLVAGPALAASSQAPLKHVQWSFSGPFGSYDQAQLQRGFKVYREVCSQCHALNLVSFHDLGQPGGPFWDPKYPNPNDNPYVKAIAADYKVADIDPDTGENMQRAATSADHPPAPYANDTAAKATLGGAPPDMSLLVKAREGGPDYVYSLVTGYAPAPQGLVVPPGKYYNPYMLSDLASSWKGTGPAPVGGIIAMPPPLTAGKVSFDDGAPSTLDQEAKDVAAFLTWASDPKMDQRKQTGLAVLVYLAIFSGLLYASYRRIWRNVAH
ncbi:MAG: cytochrome c1 [Caulobacteraceae bacterium]|nr:cytochrome c1 [Caulobacteraceae bacterium]